MHRLWWVAPALLAIAASPAAAEPTQLGAWFGPRLFSSSSRLGYIDDAPEHPALQNGMELGARVARPFLPWLVPELELALSPTSTSPVRGARSTSVLWFEPRLHLRFEIWPERQIQPFIVVGGGAPVSLSSAKQTYANAIIGDGYAGGGVRFDTQKGFELRLDARLAFVPSQPGGFGITPELDIGIGIEVHIGAPHQMTAEEARLAHAPPPPDRDGDGIPDDQDACPDRPEDVDGFEDADGCPDIDNDLDRVLDIADKCPNVPETYNGYEDEDGCPDTVPPDVDALRGTIEGLIYADGETVVRDSALPSIRKIAKTMQAHPTIRVVLVGHTDDREAKQLAADGQPADLDSLSADLSRARAEAVKNALAAAGIAPPRIVVEGHGFDEPVADNARPRGRLANRRVEIKLYVPSR
ncbi:MAG: OmpA family protein [Deltaproteobacteria bacterium]|nr:MAG: OmpA family protein [Deltaproteobacteria bacterium]TMQ22292.1 MAG: OmpA family protein [Deltaproteobacteria bacterium]